MTKEILVTGGAGFIGINFIHYLMKETDYRITNVDVLTYASHSVAKTLFPTNPRYRFFQVDIGDKRALEKVFDRIYDVIVHFAAESHVDRSIESAYPFVHTNIVGTLNLLHAVQQGKAKKMIHISTDEVYGSLELDDPAFTEQTPISPNNPYSATKAGSDMLVQAFHHTYQLPLIITRCSNNYGPYQHVEKFIPKIITSALQGKDIPIYGDGKQIRDWLFVEDHCRAVLLVMERGKIGSVYNIGANNEKENIEVVRQILDYLQAPHSLITFISDRPGHDRRYAMSYEKIKAELGWEPTVDFNTGLKRTIEWYRERLNH